MPLAPKLKLFAIITGLALPALAKPAAPSAYVGEESRQIKSLSVAETADLLAGKGIGLAKAAELNGYPGPAHVLELAAQLALSAEQRTATAALFAAMTQDAKEYGRRLVSAEQTLDALFAAGRISSEQLNELLTEIGHLQAKLRATHLEAHLEQARILSASQNAAYFRLRGYAAGGSHDAAEGHRHKHAGS